MLRNYGHHSKATKNLITNGEFWDFMTDGGYNKKEIDEATEDLLIQQKVDLSTIPRANRKIILKNVANMAQVGIAIDVTDDIHSIITA